MPALDRQGHITAAAARWLLVAEWLAFTTFLIMAVIIEAQAWEQWRAAELIDFREGVPGDSQHYARLTIYGAIAVPNWLGFTVVWLGAVTGLGAGGRARWKRVAVNAVAGIHCAASIGLVALAFRIEREGMPILVSFAVFAGVVSLVVLFVGGEQRRRVQR